MEMPLAWGNDLSKPTLPSSLDPILLRTEPSACLIFTVSFCSFPEDLCYLGSCPPFIPWGPEWLLGNPRSQLSCLYLTSRKVLPSLKLLQESTTRGQQSSLEGGSGPSPSLGQGRMGAPSS